MSGSPFLLVTDFKRGRRNNAVVVVVIALLGFSSSTLAETIQVDFGAVGHTQGAGNGTTSEGGTTWNGIEPGNSGANLTAGATQTYDNLVDSTGTGTTVDLALTWSNQTGLDFSRAWDLHQGDRDGDYLGIRGDNTGVFNSVTFSSLANGLYDITVWTQAPTDFRVDGGAVVSINGSQSVASPVNDATSHTFSSVSVTDGDVVIDWGHITSNRGADTWATTTAMSITAVPEPTSIALATFGLLGLVGLGRRRRR
jgi:hypothetical protein